MADLSGRADTALVVADVADLHPEHHLPGDLPADAAALSGRPATMAGDGDVADLHPERHRLVIWTPMLRVLKTATAEDDKGVSSCGLVAVGTADIP